MNSEKNNFDKKAVDWDIAPRIKLAEDVFKSILKEVDLNNQMKVLDFGCGTGLLSLLIAKKVKSVLGVDNSQGMLKVFEEKIQKQNIINAKTLLHNFDQGDIDLGQFDLVVTSMTMHHIKDVKMFIGKFYKMIKPGGYLAVADLDYEGGVFHENNEGVFHYGFTQGELAGIFQSYGFEDLKECIAAELSRPDKNGKSANFKVVLTTGKKNI